MKTINLLNKKSWNILNTLTYYILNAIYVSICKCLGRRSRVIKKVPLGVCGSSADSFCRPN